MDLVKRFPEFRFVRHLSTEGRVIIIDEELSPGIQVAIEDLETTNGKGTIFLRDTELAKDLDELLENEFRGVEEALLVFPGNGANYPLGLSGVCRQFPCTRVYAKRHWEPGIDPVVRVGTILPCQFLVLGVRNIVVVDDVISSGQTLRKLNRENNWRFPGATWFGASWVAQVPTMKAQSGLNGYARVLTACVVEDLRGRKVPINSLSTLRKEPSIARNYAERHFVNPTAFLILISARDPI